MPILTLSRPAGLSPVTGSSLCPSPAPQDAAEARRRGDLEVPVGHGGTEGDSGVLDFFHPRFQAGGSKGFEGVFSPL